MGDLLQGKGTKWQLVPFFGQDTIPNGSKAAYELEGKAGAIGYSRGHAGRQPLNFGSLRCEGTEVVVFHLTLNLGVI